MNRLLFILALISLMFISCKNEKNTATENIEQVIKSSPKQKAVVPPVNADSTYEFIKKQLSFGTRVPGSPGHKAMKNWLVAKIKSYGLEVTVQEFKTSFMNKSDVQAYNIIGTLNPEKTQRILLAAHWDTRLIAEKDPDASRVNIPIMGADDGGSGVAALLEIMRVISEKQIDLGVDFIFFDAEDQGNEGTDWCLGSQYWSKNLHKKDYKADWGILLDLIGAKGAMFHKEEFSRYYAKTYVDKVWSLAQKMGYGKYFIDQPVGTIQDDHYFVNTGANIPMIDIINTLPSGMFGSYHHTHKDDIGIIDKEILKAVTQVTIAAVYKYSDGSL